MVSEHDDGSTDLSALIEGITRVTVTTTSSSSFSTSNVAATAVGASRSGIHSTGSGGLRATRSTPTDALEGLGALPPPPALRPSGFEALASNDDDDEDDDGDARAEGGKVDEDKDKGHEHEYEEDLEEEY